jgi:hypothetical protein
MSDEGMAMGREGFKAEYTVKAWKEYVKSMEEQLQSLGWESMAELEKAHWSCAVLRRYGEAKEGEEDTQTSTENQEKNAAFKGGKGKRKSEPRRKEEEDGDEEVVAKPSSSRAERAAKRVKAGDS